MQHFERTYSRLPKERIWAIEGFWSWELVAAQVTHVIGLSELIVAR